MTISETEGLPDTPAGDHMADQAARLASVRAPDIESEGEAAPDDLRQVDEEGHVIGQESETMDREAFKALFRHIWNIPGLMVAHLKPLSITPDKADACDECAEATFDLCEMHFPGLLKSDNATAAALMRALPFVLMQAGAMRAIMADRREQRAQVRPRAANNSAPPQFKSARAPDQNQPGPFDYMDDERIAA